MNFNFVLTRDNKYFNTTINLHDGETIDNLLDKLMTEAYAKPPLNPNALFIFTNKDGLSRFNEWLAEKFGPSPISNDWGNTGVRSGTTLHMQPFGSVHIIEI